MSLTVSGSAKPVGYEDDNHDGLDDHDVEVAAAGAVPPEAAANTTSSTAGTLAVTEPVPDAFIPCVVYFLLLQIHFPVQATFPLLLIVRSSVLVLRLPYFSWGSVSLPSSRGE